MKHLFNILQTGSLLLTSTLLCLAAHASTTNYQQFAEEMAKKHGFDAKILNKWLSHAELRQDIIDRMNKPAEALPWYKYEKIFLTQDRVEKGLAFWQQHQKTLQQAEQTYGVPSHMIMAILGVETNYGKIQGKFPVLESLKTLAFHYPKRSKFFRKELEQYLLLARSQDWALNDIYGSYAGAMGYGQFISSSYRHYAVDFDADGKINLFEPVDAIGSIANYLHKHGWDEKQFIAVDISSTYQQKKPKTKLAIKKYQKQTKRSIKTLAQKGLAVPKHLSSTLKADLYQFAGKDQKQYVLAGHNFFVIMSYNHSPLYARAVWQLGEQLREQIESHKP